MARLSANPSVDRRHEIFILGLRIMTTAHSRRSPSQFPRDFVAFMAPFLVQILVLPGWALARLPDSSLQLSPPLVAAAWPLLLVPALAAASAVYWRREPGSGVRFTIFAGAASGAAAIAAFFVFVLAE